jgi:hypothetical protein
MFLGNWSVAYHYLSRDENCFGQRLNATDVMYFTMTTLTTTGYGDIKPRSALCRRFVTLQMIEDLILTGSVLAIVGDAIISVTRRREDVAKSSH